MSLPDANTVMLFVLPEIMKNREIGRANRALYTFSLLRFSISCPHLFPTFRESKSVRDGMWDISGNISQKGVSSSPYTFGEY